ncbi:hypothetical protein GGF46_000044 [Coemansia sp. RSA 552]|nr:hypothetical protein GGF46_000044 [Coemansia sp. RSA 552]
MTQQGWTAFRAAEKRYKTLDYASILSSVVDTSTMATADEAVVRRLDLAHDFSDPRVFSRRRPPAYTLAGHPGLIVIPNPFTDGAQRWLARKCLCDCACPPNRTNLDPFFDMPPESLFTLAAKPNSATSALSRPATIGSRLQSGCIEPGVTPPKDRFYGQAASAPDLLGRLRWCTLGWQYNWTTKMYDLGASAFDHELDRLMRTIATAITCPAFATADNNASVNSYDGWQFASEAGIINFYDERYSMAGHVDKTEDSMDAPLISLSVGLACVYLIGGPTRDTEPTPLLLRSGDVLAMCGESRLAFHGVPRVLPDTAPAYLVAPEAGDQDTGAEGYPPWRHFAEYLETHRINCNARKCS